MKPEALSTEAGPLPASGKRVALQSREGRWPAPSVSGGQSWGLRAPVCWFVRLVCSGGPVSVRALD